MERDGLPVFGGPRDGATMPSSGPSRYHYEFNGLHYWYVRAVGKWSLYCVNDGEEIPRAPTVSAK